MKKLNFAFAALLVFSTCKHSTHSSFTEIDGIDSSIRPGDNFFMYVNHRWYDSAQVPLSQSGVGTYMFMNYPQRLRLQQLLDSVSRADNKPGSIAQQIGDFYASGMDTVAINNRGYAPVNPLLAAIDSINDIKAVIRFAAGEVKTNSNSIIGFYVGPDNKNSSLNIAHLYQAGIGLPGRDYYFRKDAQTVAIQQAYKKYINSLFQLTGTAAEAAGKNAETVYNLEKQLAAAHRDNVELRDVKANYNKMSVISLERRQPAIGWQILFDKLGAKTDSVDIGQPAYYEKLNALLSTVSIGDWKLYLKAQMLDDYAESLSKPFADASFDFNKVVSGQSVQKTRGEKMAAVIDKSLGEALGQLYVKKYFSEAAKKRTIELVNNLQKALAARLDRLDWMGDSTKQKAKEKLSAISKKIGYPDKWRDYSDVKIARDKYFENVVAAATNNYRYQLAKLNKPVDKSEWYSTPSTVTAYNNPAANEIVFPAGILQSPYFDVNADDAFNYGGIGMVIGHELTHTFDDQGAQYDKNGNVSDWWTKADYAVFKLKTQKVIDLYNKFTVLDTMHVKGAMTVGENTADIAGVAIAYDAFKLTKQGQDTTRIGGYTPDQRFFISVAKIWRVKMTDAYLRLWINNNPHSPPLWRVNSPLMNSTAFYKAFNVQPGDSNYLAPAQRVEIW